MNHYELFIIIPLILGFLSIIIKKSSLHLYGGIIFNIILLFFVKKGTSIIGGFKPPFGISLVLDNYSLIGLLAINILFLIVIFISKDSIKKYQTVLLIALAGLNGMILTGDLFNLFVFLEITAITAYILSSENKNYKNALHYLIIGTVGSGLYLFGIILIYNMFGTLNMIDLSNKLQQVDTTFITIPVLMIFIGLAVETKLMPFSSWVKGVLGNSNDLVGALISSVYAGTTLLVFGRLFSQVFTLPSVLKTILLVITVSTVLFGEIAAFSRSKIREILLYSSIAQAGVITTLFISGLVFPAILHLLNNIFSKLILFSIAGKIAVDTKTDKIEDLKGIFYKNKLIGLTFSIASLSILGLPFFFGFYSKINMLFGLFNQNNYITPGVFLFSTIIEGSYFISMLVKLWMPGEEGQYATGDLSSDKTVDFSFNSKLGSVILAITIVLLGLIPSLFTDNLYKDKKLLNENNPPYILYIKDVI